MAVPIVDKAKAEHLRKENINDLQNASQTGPLSFENMRKYGTSGGTHVSAHIGDTPVKNLGGVGIIDLPDASGPKGDLAMPTGTNRLCWHCSITCHAVLKEGT